MSDTHAGAPAVDLDKELAQLHRYTVTGEGTTRGYFRLVEDAEGAWLTFAEVEAFVERLRVSSRSPDEGWREQDEALQAICRECGDDEHVSCPADVVKLVRETLASRSLETETPQAPEAPHVNPDFVECWQSGWRAGWLAHTNPWSKHLKDESVAAHLALDKANIPTTKKVPNRAGDGKQDITIGLAERVRLLASRSLETETRKDSGGEPSVERIAQEAVQTLCERLAASSQAMRGLAQENKTLNVMLPPLHAKIAELKAELASRSLETERLLNIGATDIVTTFLRDALQWMECDLYEHGEGPTGGYRSRVAQARAAFEAHIGRVSAPTEAQLDEEVVVAMLAACEATLRHLWDIAGRFDNKESNAIRDEIHVLNKITLPAIRDLNARLASRASAPTPPGSLETETRLGEAFGWVQRIIGIDDAGDDPNDLIPCLRTIYERQLAAGQEKK